MTQIASSSRVSTSVLHHRIDDQLRAIIESPQFARSRRRQALLRFLVEETLAGRTDSLKAYKIGRKVLDRPSGFNPQTDPIVRVEVGRLRSSLDAFYRSRPGQLLVIDVPKGSYVAKFTSREHSDGSAHDRRHGVLQVSAFRAMSDSAQELANEIRQTLATTVTAASSGAVSVDLADNRGDLRTPNSEVRLDVSCRLDASVWVIDQRIRLAIELLLPGQTAPLWADSFDDELTTGHEFDVVDRLAERISWLLIDEWGPLARAGIHLMDTNASLAISDSQRVYHQTFDAVQATALNVAGASLTAAANEEPSDPRTLAALADTKIATWLLGAENAPNTLLLAEEMAIRAIGGNPTLPEAHLAMGYVHYANRRPEAMRVEFEHALELGPPSPNTLHCAAFIWALDGEWERAEQLTRRAVELSPDLPAYWHLVPCIAAIHRNEPERAYMESLQVGDTMSFLGPVFRLACAHRLGIDGTEDAKQAASLMPAPAVQLIEETINRAVHDTAIAELLIGAVTATPAVLPS
ncbi:MAG: hypothetical protein IZT58_02270 [Actinobacteria bacterium]|nr:hypothetical protein [Actinomycetota bacterium]